MEAKTKIEIKSRFDGHVLFELEITDNTIKRTLQEAVERDADLCGANLCDADLCGANLCGANLCGADLCGANLCGANLCGANLCGADLCDADLRDADLCDADLCGADLRDADLRDADLCGADLRDADLCGANLCGANLCGCVLDYNDNDDPDGYGDTGELLKGLEKDTGVRVTTAYENHDAFASRWGVFWRNLIIIRKWKIVTKKEDGIELPQDEAELLRAWLNQSGYPDKRFTIRRANPLASALIITITDTEHSIDLRTKTGIDAEADQKYTLNGNRIIKA